MRDFLTGGLVGVLGVPVGLLLGLGTGALIGGLSDMDEADMQDETLARVGRHVPPARNALLAEVDEYADDVVDGAGRRRAPPGPAVPIGGHFELIASVAEQARIIDSFRKGSLENGETPLVLDIWVQCTADRAGTARSQFAAPQRSSEYSSTLTIFQRNCGTGSFGYWKGISRDFRLYVGR
jgi:Protein of unknown function (DUF1269)